MARPFKPGETVHVVDLLPYPGYYEPGPDDTPIWVEPSFKVTLRAAVVQPDGKSIPAPDGDGTVPIDEKMVFHYDEQEKAHTAAQELISQFS